MKIALISGSRSDRNALIMVERALTAANHDVRWIDVADGYSTKMSWDACISANYASKTVRLSLGDHGGDLAIVHGDRHEILGATVAANIMGIPIAHIGGGDLTEGSQDDCFRHAITKLSHLHFASNQDSADRIVQMGEEPDRVHVTGCPGIDMVMTTPTLDRDDTFIAIGLSSRRSSWKEFPPEVGEHYVDGPPVPQRSLLVLFHPDTLGGTTSGQLEALSVALSRRTEALVLLGPNADAGGDLIRREWQRLAQNRPDTVYHDNVEPQVFYSLLKWCDVLVGNSSAGFYEAPCFGIPVVDLWDRQHGRQRPDNVISPHPDDVGLGTYIESIGQCIDLAVGRGGPSLLAAQPRARIANYYGDGHAAERIAKVIGGIKDPRALLRKRWHHVIDVRGDGERGW